MRTITTKLFATILSILTFGGMVSCTNEMICDYGILDIESSEQPQSPYHIPLSEALGNLESMMNEMGMDNTRALQRGRWTVQRIPMSAFKPQTRSGGETEVGDAIYVVNFDNDEGFAILSADDRLPDDVIAVSSRGNLIDFKPYPEDGNEDTLTLEDLYVPADDDYLLGSTSPDRVIGGLVTNYIIGWTDSLGGDVGGKFPNIPTIPPIDELIYSYEYETIENISEMLITTWHQQSPFNDYCDKRYYYKNWLGVVVSDVCSYDLDAVGKWGNKYVRVDTLAAGCVAIAMAQILAYNNYPSVNVVVDETNAMPWDSLVVNKYCLDSVGQARQSHYLAKVVHSIGVGCDMKYGFWKKQSFATPTNAQRFLTRLGYANVHKCSDFDYYVVRRGLRNGCPVFVGALGPLVSKCGHAWLIDGYQQIQQNKVGKTSLGEVVSSTPISNSYYFHFNWGWGGSYDGWFSYNIMNNPSFSPADDYIYDRHFRIITYDKPMVE